MRFAANIPTSAGTSEYSTLAFCGNIEWKVQKDYAKTVETAGFDGIAIPDHLMTGDGATMECLTVASALAQETETVEIYPKTINNELRHGPFLAKIIATLDNVSEGRIKLGMGAGWKEDEAVAYGYEWPNAPERLRAMEETIELTKLLWTNEEVDYAGSYYELNGAVCKPDPLQSPCPPIMIGGGGEEFTLQIAAKHADEWNYWGSSEMMEHKLEVLANHCITHNREYESIDKSWFARCIIRESEQKVEEILDQAPRFRNTSSDDPLSQFNNLIGTPETIIEELSDYREIGIDETILEFVDFPDTTGIELFAETVQPEFE